MERHDGDKLVAASVAGLLAAGAWFTGVGMAAAHGEGVPCYGINTCQGRGDCGGKGHSCHGHNDCKGQGFVALETKEDCLRIINGRLTAESPATTER